MIVCHCRRVNDATIRAAIVGGARTVAEVSADCGAGGRCGGCIPAIERLLAGAEPALVATAPCGGRSRAYLRPLETLASLRAQPSPPAEDT